MKLTFSFKKECQFNIGGKNHKSSQQMALKPDDILPVMASHGPDVVGRQQAPLPCALVAPEHPAGIDLLGVGDQITLHQGHFVCIRRRVAEHGLVTFLWTAHGHPPFSL